MPLEIVDVEQNSPDWFAARCGIPTASEFKSVLAKGQGKTRSKYLHKLAGEVYTGEPEPSFSNGHTDRGHEMEEDGADAYALIKGLEPKRVGFMRNGRVGASPDRVVDDDGLVEIKSKLPSVLSEIIIKGGMVAEHKAQVQGQLWVAEREWCDLVCYWPNMPLFIHREHRDDEYIGVLSAEVDRFLQDLDGVVEKIRRYGGAHA